MLKSRLNLRNVTTIVAFLAVTMGFASCETDDDGIKVPETVENFTASAGNGQVSLTWEAPPDNGGADIIGYEVTMGEWRNKVEKTASQQSHTYTDLTNGTEYTFKVRVVNVKGFGAESTQTATPTAGNSGGDTTLPENAKLKRISSIHLGFSNKEEFSYEQFVANPEIIWYVSAEYEYDNLGRISKIYRPMYDNGNINGVISYDIYTYNDKSQLEKIAYYNANLYEGFINLRTYTYSYDKDGNKRKEVIVYPRALPFRTDSTLYYYDNNRLKRKDNYSESYHGTELWHSKLTTYIEYEYDNQGQLVKETNYSATDNTPIQFSVHSYQNGLNVKTEVFTYYNIIGKTKLREIRCYYDDNGNLIYVESQEHSGLSSSLSYISKYEYY